MTRKPFGYDDLRCGVRRYGVLFFVVLLVTVGLTFAVLRTVTPLYTASMVVAPAKAKTQMHLMDEDRPMMRNDVARADDELTETPSDFARYIQVLTSPEVVAMVMADKGLDLAARVAPDNALRRLVFRLAGQEEGSLDDPIYVARKTANLIRVDAIGRSTMRMVSLRHADRLFAIKTLAALHGAADRYLRLQALDLMDRDIGSLRQMIRYINYVQQRRTLNRVLVSKEQNALLLQSDTPFAAQFVQQPEAPQRADWPNVPVTLMLSAVFGIFLGWLAVYAASVRLWLRKTHTASLS